MYTKRKEGGVLCMCVWCACAQLCTDVHCALVLLCAYVHVSVCSAMCLFCHHPDQQVLYPTELLCFLFCCLIQSILGVHISNKDYRHTSQTFSHVGKLRVKTGKSLNCRNTKNPH